MQSDTSTYIRVIVAVTDLIETLKNSSYLCGVNSDAAIFYYYFKIML